MKFFPSPFISNQVLETKDISLGFTVNSGKNAIRLALRSFDLPPFSSIGIPAFCCDAVLQAVKEENLTPVFFDLKEDGTFWSNYSEELFKEKKIKGIILTHLYGFMHPDTKHLMELCEKEKIALIHDAAQSFGVDTALFGKQLIVYSFGPGKSTTAALGGEIVNFKNSGIINKPNLADALAGELFFKSRLNDYSFTFLDKVFLKLSSKFKSSEKDIFDLSEFQKQKAKEAKCITLKGNNERVLRYDLLKKAVEGNISIRMASNSDDTLKFKIVLYVLNDPDKFASYLASNNIHFFRLYSSIDISERSGFDLPVFKSSAERFIEISTERSIPMLEMERVAKIISAY